MTRWLVWAALGAGVGIASAASAGEAVDRTLDASGATDVSITVRRGAVEVLGADGGRVQVSGTLDDRSEGLVFEREGDSIEIEDRVPENLRSGEGTRLTVRVPKGVRVRAALVSAHLTVTGVDGGGRLHTVSGDIVATALGGDVSVGTVSGDIEIDHVGPELRVDAVSGDVVARARTTEVDVETVSGDASVDNEGTLRRGRMSTVSGDLDLATAFLADGDLSLDTVSGDVALTLRGPVDARIEVDAGPGGEIENGLDGRIVRQDRAGPGESLTLSLGKGSGEIEVSTVSGTVELRQQDAAPGVALRM
jgi:hypothetical protein